MSNPSQQQELQQGAQSFSQDEFSSLLNKEFRPKTDQARSAVESAVKTLAQQALENTVTFSSDTYRTIQNLIAGIDEKLSQQINQIIHHEDFQKLESAWQQQAGTASSPQSRENATINLVKDERIIVTSIHDIYYAEAHEKMTFVYTKRESYVMPMNITEFCSKLPTAHFFRCHRSYCVNLDKIREIEPWFNNTYILRLRDLDFQVPVSRSKVKEFRQLMNL